MEAIRKDGEGGREEEKERGGVGGENSNNSNSNCSKRGTISRSFHCYKSRTSWEKNTNDGTRWDLKVFHNRKQYCRTRKIIKQFIKTYSKFGDTSSFATGDFVWCCEDILIGYTRENIYSFCKIMAFQVAMLLNRIYNRSSGEIASINRNTFTEFLKFQELSCEIRYILGKFEHGRCRYCRSFKQERCQCFINISLQGFGTQNVSRNEVEREEMVVTNIDTNRDNIPARNSCIKQSRLIIHQIGELMRSILMEQG